MSTSGRNRFHTSCAVTLFLLVVSFSNGLAFTADKRDTLRGLSQVAILIEFLPDELEREGLSREQFKREIEQRLKEAGLRVLTTSEAAKVPGAPYLYVSMAPVTAMNGNGYVITVAMKQLVQLARDPTTELFVSTWETTSTINGNGTRGSEMKARLGEAVERLLIDYRAVNAK